MYERSDGFTEANHWQRNCNSLYNIDKNLSYVTISVLKSFTLAVSVLQFKAFALQVLYTRGIGD